MTAPAQQGDTTTHTDLRRDVEGRAAKARERRGHSRATGAALQVLGCTPHPLGHLPRQAKVRCSTRAGLSGSLVSCAAHGSGGWDGLGVAGRAPSRHDLAALPASLAAMLTPQDAAACGPTHKATQVLVTTPHTAVGGGAIP